MRRSRILKVLVVWLAAAAAASAQAPPSHMNAVSAANLPAQRIGVNDLLAISVYRSPELSRTVRVNGEGEIALPLLAHPVRAEGLLPGELETALAAALKQEGILVNPIVEVTVAEYASRPIAVMGAVKRPLTFQAVGRVTLLDALARAEGLAPEASHEVLVSVPGGEAAGGERLLRRIPVEGLIDEADPALNIELKGGEEIRVPEAGRIFVVGNVKKPGAFAVRDERDATVLKMIAMAEGLAPYASKQAYIYRKSPDTGEKREIEIELKQIMKRELPDVPLEASDVLYIPDNTGKRATVSVIDRVVGFGASTVSGILIWGNR